ncbi:hypothetical protein EHV15_18410 [Paenibacillus oralis]|uniref:DUF4179 domain-containing protein n=1 Tax=Paenibacillus oralis TaxID=2490856 RepID=A0A3P3U2U2_9BACL|nr:hypothetical protein [Paenibacillus oralis]RRJ64672.1 hypothetical protein EHV15_18410 [Paenibacillus oralis]
MLDTKIEMNMKKELQWSLNQLTAPEALRDFARNIALHSESSKVHPLPKKRKAWLTGVAAGAAAVSILFISAEISPAFASMLKQIPGISVAADWLDSIRSQDGVKNAAANKYTPFEPVVQQFGDMKVSLADVYLTSDKLMYKAFIQTDGIKDHLAKNPDGSLTLDRTADFYAVQNSDFEDISGAGSSEDIITDQETGEPILVISEIMELNPEEVQAFLKGNPDTLHFTIFVDPEPKLGQREGERNYAMNVPFSSSQWLEDRIIQGQQRIEVAGDPDIRGLVLENIRITPLNTYAELRLDNSRDYLLDIDSAEDAIKLTDNNGKVYPLDSYRPISEYLPLDERYQPGMIELTFNSSPFFDETVKSLTLHVNAVEISDWTGSDTFTLGLNDELPKPIRFKGKEMTITETRYEDGLLKLKVLQKAEDRMSVRFDIPSLRPDKEESPELWEEYYGEKADLRKELIIPSKGKEEYELSFLVPKQDTYEIRMMRETDPVQVDKTLEIELEP